MPLQALYTRYKDLPDPESPLLAEDSVYSDSFELHEATIAPLPFREFFKIGMLYFPDRIMGLGYDPLRYLFWRLHRPTIYLLGHIREHSPALISLAADLGPSGFAASEVVWWLSRTTRPPSGAFRASWMRYVAPFGEVNEEWVNRREREIDYFTAERRKF